MREEDSEEITHMIAVGLSILNTLSSESTTYILKA